MAVDIQGALGGLSDPVAMRNAILQRLGINAPQVAGLGGQAALGFDQGIQNLYRQGAETSANLDLSEGNLNRGYQQNLSQAAIDRDRALKALTGQFADRGMTFSGANLEQQNQTNSDWDRYLANLGSENTSGLADIGNKRQSLYNSLIGGRQQAEEGYVTDINDFLKQQAVGAWTSAIQAQQQQQMMQALQSRPAAAASPRPPSTSGGVTAAGLLSGVRAPAPKSAARPVMRPAPTSRPTARIAPPPAPRPAAPIAAKKTLTPLKGRY